MARLGIEAFPDDFLTSTDATIRYLQGGICRTPASITSAAPNRSKTSCPKNQLAGLHVAEQLRDEISVVLSATTRS